MMMVMLTDDEDDINIMRTLLVMFMIMSALLSSLSLVSMSEISTLMNVR